MDRSVKLLYRRYGNMCKGSYGLNGLYDLRCDWDIGEREEFKCFTMGLREMGQINRSVRLIYERHVNRLQGKYCVGGSFLFTNADDWEWEERKEFVEFVKNIKEVADGLGS